MMKRTITYFSLLLSVVFVQAQTKQAVSIAEKEVPKKVVAKFKEKRPVAQEVVWYPYPNQYGKDYGTAPVYFPIGWSNNAPDYYEVRFSDSKGAGSDVYDRTGVWKVTSRPIESSAIPEGIKVQLSEKGYESWKTVKSERISREGQKGSFYKIWITEDNKKRILFFDQSFQLVKVLRWDNDLKMMVNANAKLRDAPGYKKTKKVLSATDVPDAVRTKAKKNHLDVEIIEWSTTSRVYDPFAVGALGFSYYDVSIPSFYQVIFSDKSGKFMATYSATGELLEVAEMVMTKKLPKPVKGFFETDEYQSWKLEKEHEKVDTADGETYYRVYAIENDSFRMVVLNADGSRKKGL